MAPKPKVKLEANFRPAKQAAHESVMAAVRAGVDAAHETARRRLALNTSRRGYDFGPELVDKETGGRTGSFWGGSIYATEWWARFFEHGTVRIEAMPFIRPGYNKGRRVLLATLESDFEGWVRRRARVRGSR